MMAIWCELIKIKESTQSSCKENNRTHYRTPSKQQLYSKPVKGNNKEEIRINVKTTSPTLAVVLPITLCHVVMLQLGKHRLCFAPASTTCHVYVSSTSWICPALLCFTCHVYVSSSSWACPALY
ncbi:hypothetical protein Cni_G06860 [Canna indica]|uniref:Uncharacterized protein n=1 Tax=Canna indica TaxID=4628 RepID=A0AAQ3K2Q0_9LILI|nr:hypothetical protein Cni_G06860 [Canna indica]